MAKSNSRKKVKTKSRKIASPPDDEGGMEEQAGQEVEESQEAGDAEFPNAESSGFLEDEDVAEAAGQSETKAKAGIVYLSSVPYFMSAKRVKELLSMYGELGRVFLKREVKVGQDGKRRKEYTEGWVEFKDKKTAKKVALCCNNAPVGGKRRAKYREALWNMKYLNRFQWLHLEEQLRYEKEVRKQKMRTEVAQARREGNFFAAQVDKGENLKRLEETILKKGGHWEKKKREFKQKKVVQDRSKRQDAILDLILGE